MSHDENKTEESVLQDTTVSVEDSIDGTDTAGDEFRGHVRTRPRWSVEIFDFLEMLVLASCIIMFLFSFVARISTVDGTSMARTLDDGDKLIVSDLFYTPKQGDIVVFQDMDSHYDSAIVKRVIATGGQTVTLRYANEDGVNRVTVILNPGQTDEQILQEDYRFYDLTLPLQYQYRYTGEFTYTVPDGFLFVMGDNTYNSEDSRGEFGMVSEDTVLGRVIFRLAGRDLSDLFQKFGPVR